METLIVRRDLRDAFRGPIIIDAARVCETSRSTKLQAMTETFLLDQPYSRLPDLERGETPWETRARGADDQCAYRDSSGRYFRVSSS